MLEHFVAAARACDPTPFYVYEFAARSGYAVPVIVIERLREAVPNFSGLKVSDTPFEASPLPVGRAGGLVGPEPLIDQAMARRGRGGLRPRGRVPRAGRLVVRDADPGADRSTRSGQRHASRSTPR